MEDRSTEYLINYKIFRVIYGDITQQQVEVLVSSDDNLLSMGGEVSSAIAAAGGEEIGQHARKLLPLGLGDVVVTTAGQLSAKYVFHAVTIDFSRAQRANEDSVRAATLRCMELADALQLRTIAFPALATGVGGFPFESAAEVMTRAVGEYLMGSTRTRRPRAFRKRGCARE
jgi:O-acetyl-ADP-ribose deacetylase (regulator of RNase III)